jgi:hypothetical protein
LFYGLHTITESNWGLFPWKINNYLENVLFELKTLLFTIRAAQDL